MQLYLARYARSTHRASPLRRDSDCVQLLLAYFNVSPSRSSSGRLRLYRQQPHVQSTHLHRKARALPFSLFAKILVQQLPFSGCQTQPTSQLSRRLLPDSWQSHKAREVRVVSQCARQLTSDRESLSLQLKGRFHRLLLLHLVPPTFTVPRPHPVSPSNLPELQDSSLRSSSEMPASASSEFVPSVCAPSEFPSQVPGRAH